jgi:hypothetical protein
MNTKPTMPKDAYIAIARADNVWREVVASFAIEGMSLSGDIEIIIGQMIAQEISCDEAIAIIKANTVSNNLLT